MGPANRERGPTTCMPATCPTPRSASVDPLWLYIFFKLQVSVSGIYIGRREERERERERLSIRVTVGLGSETDSDQCVVESLGFFRLISFNSSDQLIAGEFVFFSSAVFESSTESPCRFLIQFIELNSKMELVFRFSSIILV